MSVRDRYNDFYITDQFRDLSFRVANVSSIGEPVPALSGADRVVLLLGIALLGTTAALRLRRGANPG